MKKGCLVAILVVFLLLMGGAYVLYQGLSGLVEAETLVETTEAPIVEEGEEESAEVTGETEAPAETESTAQRQDEKTEEEAQADAETQAPDFIIFDGAGKEAKLSDFFGKPIVLNFWASWCGPCKSEMPSFNEKYLEVGDKVQFLMVNMTDGAQETKASAEAYLSGQNFSFPVYFDTEMDAAITYGVWSLPTTYFIDADGNLTAQAKGSIDAQTLQKGIELILE